MDPAFKLVCLCIFIFLTTVFSGAMLKDSYNTHKLSIAADPISLACAMDARHVACTILAGRK